MNQDWWTQLCAVIDAKDTGGFLARLAPDAEFRFANGPAAVGHAAIGAAVDGFWASIRGSRHEIVRTWHDGDGGVCEGWCTYTRHDGSTVRLPFVDVLYFRDGKAAKYFIYMDVAPLYGQGTAGRS
jgi:ketosteroid isomerase-like protein